ncbi:SDR family oxidoreductase [Homoserinibacter sp. YIM 151385]|uniref:SDR family oxidoreductase n=1 Tax=Homoserinibacter sp. YIM 151385 TaxID=2985506 RepID=UPI0022F0C94D|nr:SDR family oxidoreductase [Homoserinibacter sp. YIM 151385]WBU39039.1 SDR family oxidoreductase [Homoserinibacter sp. YIM 151385]
MTILVTGASGHLGRLAVEALIARGFAPADIRAGARDTSRIADLAARGVEAVPLDYDAPASVEAAVRGVEQVLLVSASEPGKRVPQHLAVIDAAKAAGVAQLVYTSAPRATESELVVAPDHKATEEAIAASGIPATILRNNWYTENYLGTAAQARETGVVASSAGDGRVASASRRDYAEAAAVVLTTPGHLGEVYELGGDTSWDFAELAAALAEVLGREVALAPLSTEAHRAALRDAGLDEATASFVTTLDADIRDGALAEVTGQLSRLIGRPTTPLREGLREALA